MHRCISDNNDHWDWYYDNEGFNNDRSYDYFTVIFVTFFHGIDRVQPCFLYSFSSLTYFPSSATYVLGCKITTKQITNDKPGEKLTSREEKWTKCNSILQFCNYMQSKALRRKTANNHVSKLTSKGSSVSWVCRSGLHSGRYDEDGNLRWWRSLRDDGDLHGLLVLSESEEGGEDEDVNCITVGDGYSSRRWRRRQWFW